MVGSAILSLLLFSQLAVVFGKDESNVKGKQPHIVFILVDDMGFNDFYTSSDLSGAWSNVATMAKECVKVEHYYTQPICTPTRAAFISGRHPIRLGLQHDVIKGYQDYGLPLDEATLADKLRAVGYKTVGVGKWHLGLYNNASTPTKRGFDHWYGYWNGAEDYLTHEVGGYLDLHDDEKVDYVQTNVYSATLFAGKVVERIHEHRATSPNSPLFLYFPIQNVHDPLEALSLYSESSACKDIPNKNRKTFCGMARAADDAIGNVTKALEAAFGGEDVVLVISGDNGGMPFSAGNNCPSGNKDSGLCLRGHKAELYEGGVRNHAILCSKTLIPDAAKGYTYTKGLVHVMDWHATFRDLAGAKDKPGKPSDGVNVWDAIIKNQVSPRTELLHNIDPCSGHGTCGGTASAYRFQGCVGSNGGQCGDWKLLVGVTDDEWYYVPSSEESPLQAGWQEIMNGHSDRVDFPPGPTVDMLFNLTADPNEKTNLASNNSEVVTFLKAKIDAFSKQALAPCNIPNGSCYDDDSQAASVLKQHKAWVPWAADPFEISMIHV